MNIENYFVKSDMTLREAMSRINETGNTILLLVDAQNVLKRTVTDGDIRRLLLSSVTLDDTLEKLPEDAPIVLQNTASKREALVVMNKHDINHIPMVNAQGVVTEIVERRDIDEQILLSTPHMGDEELSFVHEAFTSNWIAPLGPNVDFFEKELSEVVGIEHAAALSSGTAAIHLALKVLGVQEGDYVLCSSFTFVASSNPILYERAIPIFIDSDMASWNMCPESMELALSSLAARGIKPKAAIVVNLYGQSADYEAICALCERYEVPIIEDAAESLGSTYKQRSSGTFGALGVFSFNGNKIITTSGGGMLVSKNPHYIEKARFLSTQAKEAYLHYEHTEVGYNYRMSNILAGVGRGQLKVLAERVARRRQNYKTYRERLADFDFIEWQPELPDSVSNRWLSAFYFKDNAPLSKERFSQLLADDLIETRPLWKPMHLQPLYRDTEFFSVHSRPVCDELFERGVCLPSGSNLLDEQLEKITDVIGTVFKNS